MRPTITFISLVMMLGASQLSAAEPTPVAHGDRRAFAAAMAKLTPGMSAAEVKAILGEQDDIRTQFDPGGPTGESTREFTVVEDIRWVRDTSGQPVIPFKNYHLNEIWAYGTYGHLTTATLGMVYLDDNGRMQESYGGKGEPPPPGLLAESDLRHCLWVLAQVPPWLGGENGDSKKIIRAVNLLQPMGKYTALAVIKEFLRVTPEENWLLPGRGGVVLVLEALFASPLPVARPAAFRHLSMVGDMPFVRPFSGSIMGPPPEPEPELDYFRTAGVLRLQPLTPSGSTSADATMPPAEPPVAYRRQIWRSPAEVTRPFALILERQTQQTVNLVLRWKADQIFHLRFYHPDHPETTLLMLSANGGPTAALQLEAGGDRRMPGMKSAVSNQGRACQITILSNVGESLVAEYSADEALVHSPVLTP